MLKKVVVLLVTSVALSGLTACGSTSATTSATAASPAATSPTVSNSPTVRTKVKVRHHRVTPPRTHPSAVAPAIASPTKVYVPAPRPSQAPAPVNGVVTIKNYGFQVAGPVTPGARVSVTNEDNVAHTVTADSGNLFNVNVPAGGRASFVAPSRPGTYAFHCNYHGEMHGTLVVK